MVEHEGFAFNHEGYLKSGVACSQCHIEVTSGTAAMGFSTFAEGKGGVALSAAEEGDATCPAFSADASYLPLEIFALGPQLAKAGGKDDGALDLVLHALLD